MTDVHCDRDFESLVNDRSKKSQLRFFVIGDFGSGDDVQTRVADAMAYVAADEPPDFILGTGDSVYPPAAAEGIDAQDLVSLANRFDDYYQKLGSEFFQCLGNEDLTAVFGGDPTPMFDHTWKSTTWRMPAAHYSIPKLPPWIAIHIANTNVFGYEGITAEAFFSETTMACEIEALTETFAAHPGVRILVGHHPIFTAGKRTFRYNGDGELFYMRRLRQAVEDSGVHFYFSGHEHHQSHITGPHCEHVTQGCGGARQAPNPKHPRRQDGWRDNEKALCHLEVVAGFAIVEVDTTYQIRMRFIGVGRGGQGPQAMRVIHEHSWNGLNAIGDARLQSSGR